LKKRVWEIAKEYNVKSNDLVDIARQYNFKINSALNALESEELEKFQTIILQLKKENKLQESSNEEFSEKIQEQITQEEKTMQQNNSTDKSKQNSLLNSKKVDSSSASQENSLSQEEVSSVKKISENSSSSQVSTTMPKEEKVQGMSSLDRLINSINQQNQEQQRQKQRFSQNRDNQQNRQNRDDRQNRDNQQNRQNRDDRQNRDNQQNRQNRDDRQNRDNQQNRQNRDDRQNRDNQQNRQNRDERQNYDEQNAYQVKQNRNGQDSFQPRQNKDSQSSIEAQDKQMVYQMKQMADMQLSYQSKPNRDSQSSYSSKQSKDSSLAFPPKPIIDKLEYSRKDKEKGKNQKDKSEFDRKIKGGKKKGDRFLSKDDMLGYDTDFIEPTINRSKKQSSSRNTTTITHVPPKDVEVQVPILLKELSQLTGIQTKQLIDRIAKCFDMEVDANSSLNENIIETLALEFDRNFIIKKEENEEDLLLKDLLFDDKEEDLSPRAPVVTFMGHVDHGKTSLLDRIKKTDIAAQEAGGITQHIGASKIEVNNQSIVFLDTPGHEAFTAMRARGANVTDIVVLVVAADDGVMPQTIEAINHAKAAKVPIIVAINKIDRPNARIENVYNGLARQELLPDKWGGDTLCVEVSAMTGQGIPELMEDILLVAEMQELKANPKRAAYGTVLEARVVEGRGDVATLLVQNGTLKQGDTILCGENYGRVRELNNYLGKKLKEAGPATPVEVCGLSGLPSAGDKFFVLRSLSQARGIAESRKQRTRETTLNTQRRPSIEDIMSQIQKGQTKELRIVLKTDVQGTLEAIAAKIATLSHEEITVKLLHAGVGAVTEGDVQLANASQAIIVAFDVTEGKIARDMAEEKGVEIRKYNIIYTLLEDLHNIMTGMLDPTKTEEVIGHVTIRKVIHISKIGNVAGCYVQDGYIERTSKIRIYRNGIILNKDKPIELDSLKRFKEDAAKVKSGFECGIKFKDFEDIKENDEIEAYKIVMVERTLD
jgi:translation initiation factor IF-2